MSSEKIIKGSVLVVALAMLAYHLMYVHSLIQVQAKHLTTHLGFSLVLVYLTGCMQSKRHWSKVILLCLSLLSLLAAILLCSKGILWAQ